MVSKFLTITVGILTFSLGLLSTYSLSKEEPEISITGRPEVENQVAKVVSPLRRDDVKFIYPDPIYSFPKTGIYFSITESNGNSSFQFELGSDLMRGPDSLHRNVSHLTGHLNGKKIKFDTIKINVQERTIILKSNNGLGHRFIFSGEFSEKSYLESEYDRQIVLTGTLQEVVMGRTVMERNFEFWYGVGC